MRLRSRDEMKIGLGHSLGELVPFVPRREQTAPAALLRRKSRYTARERYPDDTEITGALERGGVERIYGVFDREAWRAATAAAQLYLLPFGRPARADVSKLLAEARRIESGRSWWQQIGSLDPVDEAVKRHEAAGTLPAVVFPGFREAEHGSAEVDVEFPEPPHDEWRAIHKARLAGFEISAAVPAQAIKVKGIAEAAKAVRDRPVIVDPIVFGALPERKDRVVVFGFYGMSDNDSPAMKALIDVLEEMRVT